MAALSSFTSQDWKVYESNVQFLLKGDKLEFAPAGSLTRVRVIRKQYTVAIGAGKIKDGALNAEFTARVGTKNVPFVAVRFELKQDDEGATRLQFSVNPIFDAGKQPDQGGSAGGSGGSSGGGSNEDEDEDEEP